ncbi:MAG: hypothetical protein HYR97_08650 [Candidatus Melainabacteria bacterium]|nr:hypothetical protein [Candidatus Melainabacteria bacterium]MBI3309453.1 hypothetical protein [Candidatus Melainabacteria bacterium]
MANIKDAKIWLNVKKESPIKLVYSFVFFYLHFFIWLLLIASFGIIAEF